MGGSVDQEEDGHIVTSDVPSLRSIHLIRRIPQIDH